MEGVFEYQSSLLQTLKNAERNYKKAPKERIKKSYIETRLEALEQLRRDFQVGHKDIIIKQSQDSEKDDSHFEDHIYDEFEELYIQYKSAMKEDLQQYVEVTYSQFPSHYTPTRDEQQVFSNEIKLAPIPIPKFGGKYEEWQTFYDLFRSLVHNNQRLSPVQKLHYLKSNLTGDPQLLLSNFNTTEANYDEAWNQLVKRYDNKRLNCNAILKTLFTQKAIHSESASSIKNLVDTTSIGLKALANMGIATGTWDIIIIYLIMSKLDAESIKRWEHHLSVTNTDLPTWSQLCEFLETRFRSLEMIDSHKIHSRPISASMIKPKTFHFNLKRNETQKQDVTCVLCSDNHHIYHCKKFASISVKERQDFVQRNKLCFNCLTSSHLVAKCRQSTCCRKCGRRHHSLLHFERERAEQISGGGQTTSTGMIAEQLRGESTSLANNDVHIISNFSKKTSQINNVLLATAEVLVNSKNGCNYILKALLDQGSQASFVTEATVQLLNLPLESVSGWVSGVGDGHMRIKHMVSLNLKSCHDPQIIVPVSAYVLSSITTLLPSHKLISPEWTELYGLKLADSSFRTPAKIDILLGAEVYSDILLDGVIKHPKSSLLAQRTILGWVLSGKMLQESTSSKLNISSLHIQIKEDEALKLFWELENEPNLIEKKLSKEEELCERLYDATTNRDQEGRYVVKLPFKNKNPNCINGSLREISTKRLEILERKLSRNQTLKEDYHRVIEEYIQLKHMVQLSDTEVNNPYSVYLPHHAVLREDKVTTRLRVVFDGSCKGTNNVSLNDDLLVGPKLQHDLRHILMRWRLHKICITADIVKMYRMVRVAEEDTNFQRVLWRFNTNESIKHYRLSRLTFGTACAPYLAVKTLQRLADDEKFKFPVAATIAKRDFYIDDLLTGCETEMEAYQIFEEMTKLMKSGGFELQKWSSNNEQFMKYIGIKKRDDSHLPFKVNSLVKVLGVNWNGDTDKFEYTLNLPELKLPVTKRLILSEIAKLYDPLGWIAPIVVIAKMIIQNLWKTGLEWDSVIDGEILDQWLHFRENLLNIKFVSIPRGLQCSTMSTIELHVFADASMTAYGAAVYMRVIEEEKVHVSLISAKTKVAPISKQVSIPRLELCGAVLAAKLLSETSQVLNISTERLYAWTDSTIVLAWLKGGPSRWNTFVSNRVSDILNILDYNQWGHVSTDMNPADCASRGLQASEIIHKSLWWNGPAWLSSLNINKNTLDVDDTQEEERVKSLTASVRTEKDLIWVKFSNLNKLLRVISYCRRWLGWKLTKDKQCYTKHITVKEMNESLNICIKQVQDIEFNEEVKQLRTLGHVYKRSNLRNLYPILDENEILRVGGRIQQSRAEYDTKHPIILPAKSCLSRLIIHDAHHKTMHGGPQIMLNYLRAKFWIIRAKDQAKKCYRECVTCRRYSKQRNSQLMGQLPEVRVKPDRPFKSAGVDYAGPIQIRFSPGRGAKSYKGYICLFICMVTRAIHLEAVTDMTAKGFIAAFRRFTSRRGHCQDIYSDNGTNFVGADKQLKDMFNSAKSTVPSEIAHLLTLESTRWHFIPPQAPNFGGLWEAGVRSTKTHLKRVIGDTTLTYEELATVLAQVEACLNSRPLTVLSDDPNDPLPLTPGHFLIGEPVLNVADENYCLSNITYHDRWRMIQKMVNDFWNRWSKEYLVTLNHRYKWNTKKTDPEIDDVVILQEENVPPSKWLIGKIIKKHVGPDNITRVVSIKCKNGVFKRPLSKLCFLTK